MFKAKKSQSVRTVLTEVSQRVNPFFLLRCCRANATAAYILMRHLVLTNGTGSEREESLYDLADDLGFELHTFNDAWARLEDMPGVEASRHYDLLTLSVNTWALREGWQKEEHHV